MQRESATRTGRLCMLGIVEDRLPILIMQARIPPTLNEVQQPMRTEQLDLHLMNPRLQCSADQHWLMRYQSDPYYRNCLRSIASWVRQQFLPRWRAALHQIHESQAKAVSNQIWISLIVWMMPMMKTMMIPRSERSPAILQG